MKRYVIIVLIVAMLVSSCQPTPEEDVVIGKGEEQIQEMLDKSNDQEESEPIQTPREQTKAPEHLKYTIETEITGGKLYVNVDAPINVPELPMPIVTVRVKDMEFSQIDSIISLVKGDRPIYHQSYAEGVETKISIQAQIDRYLDEIRLCEEGETENKTFYMNRVKELYKMMETAPDTLADAKVEFVTPQPVIEGSEATPMPCFDAGPVTVTADNYDARSYDLMIGEGSIADRLSFNASCGSDMPQRLRYHKARMSITTINMPDIIEGFDMTVDDAISMAKPYVDGIDSSLALTDVGQAVKYHYEDDERRKEPFGYTLYYTRQYEGVDAKFAEVTHLHRMGDYRDNPVYDRPYPQESLVITVGEQGVCEMTYLSPHVEEEILAESAELLPFNEIQSIFDEQIVLGGLDCIKQTYIHINRIELSMVRIDQPNSDQYLVVPAWDFYCVGLISKEEDLNLEEMGERVTPFSNRCILTINAINGSIINRELGY